LRKRIAQWVSNILNPFFISLVLIPLLSYKSTSTVSGTLKWSLILIAISILPVYLFIIFMVRSGRIKNTFTPIRSQRTKIYLAASICAVVGYIILRCFGAPPALVATSVAGLSAVVIFMGINLLWKISLHTAFITASVTLLIILYGSTIALAAVLIPLVAWARIALKRHSLAQVVTGALLATSIVVVVFYLFGLL